MREATDILDSRLRGNDGIPSLSSFSKYHSCKNPIFFIIERFQCHRAHKTDSPFPCGLCGDRIRHFI